MVNLAGTKKENDTFGPGPLSVHTGNFGSEPKDTETKGIVYTFTTDWSG